MSHNIWFVRHGETEWNAAGRMQGQWNSDLNQRGRAQAAVSAQLLAGQPIERLVVSPLARTRQTADIINATLDVPVTLDDRIKEWDCGDWSGSLYQDVTKQHSAAWQAWRTDPYRNRAPNGEHYGDMFARARPFTEELLAHRGGDIAVVSHGMIGRVMLSILLDLDQPATLAIRQPNHVVMVVAATPPPRQACHYIGLQGPFPGPHNDTTTLA